MSTESPILRPPRLGAPEANRLFDELEQRVNQLKQLQIDQDPYLQQNQGRSPELHQRAMALERQTALMLQQQAELDERSRRIELETEQLKTRRAEFETLSAELARRIKTLEEVSAKAQSERQQIDHWRREVERQRETLARQEREWEEKEHQLAEAQLRLEVQDRELNEKRAALQQTVTQTQQQLAAQRQMMTDAQRALEAERKAFEVESRQLEAESERLTREAQAVELRRQREEQLGRAVDETLRSAEITTEPPLPVQVTAVQPRGQETVAVERGGRSRAWIAPVAVVSCVAVLAAASLLLGMMLVKPVWLATMGLTWPGQTPESARQVVFDDAVMSETLDRLAQRGQRPFDNPVALRDHLQGALGISPAPQRPGVLHFEYRHKNDRFAEAMLDSLGRAIIDYVNASTTVPAGSSPVIDWSQRAGVNPNPVRDYRLPLAAGIFLTFLFLFWLLFRRLRRRSRYNVPN